MTMDQVNPFATLPPVISIDNTVEDASSAASTEDSDELDLFPPNNTPDLQTDDIDTLVAREMSALSVQDREKAYHDLHGVSDNIKETPELLRTSLDQLETELYNMTDIHAYDTAMIMDPSYVQNEKFRLKFLRAERFDAKNAAGRLTRHLQDKLDLFGRDKLVKPITQDDLDDEAKAMLRLGTIQPLPVRDRAGRQVIVYTKQSDDLSIKAKLQALSYIANTISDDEETQRKGCVGISYLVGHPIVFFPSAHRRQWNREVSIQSGNVPLRIEGIHVCLDSYAWKPLLDIFLFTTSMFHRMRYRVHCGNHSECLFNLQTFGITTHDFPLSKDGQVSTIVYEEWLRKRHIQEKMKQNSGENPAEKFVVRIQTPGRNDVLLGRGKASYQHTGNQRLRNLVESHAVGYDGADNIEKQRITLEIVAVIKGSFGRFLKDDGAGWIEVDDDVARKKVSHAFRFIRGTKVASSKRGAKGREARDTEMTNSKRIRAGG